MRVGWERLSACWLGVFICDEVWSFDICDSWTCGEYCGLEEWLMSHDGTVRVIITVHKSIKGMVYIIPS